MKNNINIVHLPHNIPLDILALKYSAASEAYSAPLSEISN